MERIQSAIAKAREARATPEWHGKESAVLAPNVHPAVVPAPTAAPEVAVRDFSAWDALRLITLDRKALEKARIAIQPGHPETIAFDVLRTRVMHQMRTNGWTRIGITSPTASCGKTTLALNLAFGISRNPETYCVLLETDLRRPSFIKKLGLRPGPDFVKVLRGEDDFAHHGQRYAKNLAVGACAGQTRAPAELLQSTTTIAALAEIEAVYMPDIVIFDLPPMLTGDDVMAFAGQLDCVLLLAAAETTKAKEIDVCERNLASQTNVLGVVLNKCRYMDDAEGYSNY
ncbi:chromosome partitioning ATPase-like protein [Tabrizicola sp. WMC-M-20]|nr:chromosome partitioning ATPase-like protein [Tabrizicola sp. WMC-M-20]